jgi:hypothetical protein
VTMNNGVFWDVTRCGSCKNATLRNVSEDTIVQEIQSSPIFSP